jgi:hypothetical protein
VPTAAMTMPIMEPVSRPELPPLLLLPLPPEDEEPEAGAEEEGAAPKRVSVFVAAAPVGKSIGVETGDVSC